MQSGNQKLIDLNGLRGFKLENKDLQQLVNIRAELIKEFERLRHYKSDKNALMKEVDCAAVLHRTIVLLDNILKEHVKFQG